MYRLHERLVAIRTEYNLRLKAGVGAPVTQVTLQSTQRRPELEDSTLRYLQDLLAWVEENQRRLDNAEWGVDLPSVEAQLGSHRGMHQSIEEFRAKIERARNDEVSGMLEVGSGCELGQGHCRPDYSLISPAEPALPCHPGCLPRLPGSPRPAVCKAAGEWGLQAAGRGRQPQSLTNSFLLKELLQGPPPVPGELARVCGSSYQGADVAE